MRNIFDPPRSGLEPEPEGKGKNASPSGLVFGLATFLVAFVVSVYSAKYLLIWSASLPAWEPALEASKKLGSTAAGHELVFLCLTVFLPHGLIAASLVYVCSRLSDPWFAAKGYLVSLIYIAGTFGRFSYDWFLVGLSIVTICFSFGVAFLTTRKPVSK